MLQVSLNISFASVILWHSDLNEKFTWALNQQASRCFIVTNIQLHFLSFCVPSLTVYSHWLSPGPGPGLGSMGCMVLCRTFHTAPEQGQGRMWYAPIIQVLTLFQVVCFNGISMAFRCPVLVPPRYSQRERFLHNIRPSPCPCPGPRHSQRDYTTICTRVTKAIRISLYNTRPISAPTPVH